MDRMGPGGPGGTHEDLDGLGWKNMGAGCMSQGPVLYSVPCLVILLVFVATVINMEARKDLKKQSNHHKHPFPLKQC